MTQDASHHPQEVCIGAGLVTTLLFDSRLHPGLIELEAAGDFTEVEVSGRLLTLVPSGRLAAGRRLRLSVRFEDGETPASATFILVVDPLRAERQVEVFRPRSALEACLQELNAMNARTSQLQVEFEHLCTRTAQARNLERIALSKMKKEGELIVRDLSESVTRDEKEIFAVKIISYRAIHSKGPMLLQVELMLPPNDQPWSIDEALLYVGGMPTKKFPKVRQAPPLASDGLYLLLEVEVDIMGKPHTLYDLVLKTQGGKQFTIEKLAIP